LELLCPGTKDKKYKDYIKQHMKANSKYEHPNRVNPYDLDVNANYLILFHANTCFACIQFMPIWKQLYQQVYRDKNLNVDLVRVERLEMNFDNTMMLNEQAKNVAYFPTILFYNGSTRQYEEHRDARDAGTLYTNLKQRFNGPRQLKKAASPVKKVAPVKKAVAASVKKASSPKKPVEKKSQKGGDCGCNAPLPILPGALPMAGGKKPKAKGKGKKPVARRPQSGGFVRGGITLPESFYSRS
jgi:hypothetical protein